MGLPDLDSRLGMDFLAFILVLRRDSLTFGLVLETG